MTFSDPDSTHTPSSDTAIQAAWGQVMVENDQALWAGMAQSWAPWDPGLSLVNSAGDIEWEGYTHRIGHHINAHFGYRMGSTTTYSAGTVEFDLPFTLGDAGPLVIGEWVALDDSAGSYHSGLVVAKDASTTLAQLVHDAPGSNGGLISNTVPFTWAAADSLSVNINYHANAAPAGALL